jgi:hypothetical protein
MGKQKLTSYKYTPPSAQNSPETTAAPRHSGKYSRRKRSVCRAYRAGLRAARPGPSLDRLRDRGFEHCSIHEISSAPASTRPKIIKKLREKLTSSHPPTPQYNIHHDDCHTGRARRLIGNRSRCYSRSGFGSFAVWKCTGRSRLFRRRGRRGRRGM